MSALETARSWASGPAVEWSRCEEGILLQPRKPPISVCLHIVVSLAYVIIKEGMRHPSQSTVCFSQLT